MGTIRLLEQNIRELIAAGEVVERPASVVKELVENSLDAGAKVITVEIQNGGTTLMRITDDGTGIDAAQVPLAFTRHATSKISTQDDLEHIATMGFRGEALASIAAVARVEMMTRVQDALSGVHYVVHGSQEISCSEVGCPKGTTIVIRDLFYNTPARLKFLKKNVTEANAVEHVLEHIAMVYPAVSFSFMRDGETKLLTPGDSNPLSAVYAVYGKNFAGTLLPVEYTYQNRRLTGFISQPRHSRPNRAMQNFYVNRRNIRSGICAAALEEAYKGSVMVGKFPACILNITMPYDEVDVNVHPAKTEVRFHRERELFDLVYYGVKSALMPQGEPAAPPAVREQAPPVRQLKLGWNTAPPEGAAKGIPAAGETVSLRDDSAQTVYRSAPAGGAKIKGQAGEKASFFQRIDLSGPPVRDTKQWPGPAVPDGEAAAETPPAVPKPSRTQPPVQGAFAQERELPEPEDSQAPDYRLVGEVFSTYILLQSGDTLLLVDKHAAHERILYESIRRNADLGQRQLLLSPVSVTLMPAEREVLLSREAQPVLEQLGLSLEDFGANTILVREIPQWMTLDMVEQCCGELAENLMEYRRDHTPERLNWLFESMACRAAVKAGDTTSQKELEYLMELLRRDPTLRSCPHGRPIFVAITRRDLEKMFGRLG